MLLHVTDSSRSRRRATYDDVLQAPEHMVAEIIDGELYTSPRPASRHALATSRLHAKVAPAFDEGGGRPGGWFIVFEPEFHFGEDVVVPDLAGWRTGRMPAYPDVPFFTLAPDWLCEVLSPSTAHLDRHKKLGVYARERVPYAWLLDPKARRLEVLTLDGPNLTIRETHSGDDRVPAVPFDAIEIELPYLWGESSAGAER